MHARAIYAIAAILFFTQLGCTAYLAIHWKDGSEAQEAIFADNVRQILWDGSSLRVDFGQASVAPTNGSQPGSEEMKTVARLVLTRSAAEQLFRNLVQLHGAVNPSASREPTAPQL